MERCWSEFYKLTLGPLNTKEDSYHQEGCTLFTCAHAPDPRIMPEAIKMHLWDDFVYDNYRQPQVGSSVEASLKLV